MHPYPYRGFRPTRKSLELGMEDALRKVIERDPNVWEPLPDPWNVAMNWCGYAAVAVAALVSVYLVVA